MDWNSMLSQEERFDLHHMQVMKPTRGYTAESYIRAYRPERYFKACMSHEQRLEFEAFRRKNPNTTYAEYYKIYIKGDEEHE
jgi:hypothetical protein